MIPNPMTTPSDPSSELAKIIEEGKSLDTGTHNPEEWRLKQKGKMFARLSSIATQLESDLTATSEKLAEAEAAQFRAERNERDLREEVSAAFRKHGLAAGPQAVDRIIEQRDSLRAQNLALEAQVGDLKGALRIMLKSASPSQKEHPTMHAAWWLAEQALSRTPSTALGEIREKVKDILDVVSEEMQPCENEGVPNYPDILDHVHAKLTQLLTTLTGEKK